ncbi:MAG: hypothetical protein HZY76_09645 [Anaerolineae bacterium]|nr:MAG: hypothetical protein HZY76_09645 [Anaerolineae bacterium]
MSGRPPTPGRCWRPCSPGALLTTRLPRWPRPARGQPRDRGAAAGRGGSLAAASPEARQAVEADGRRGRTGQDPGLPAPGPQGGRRLARRARRRPAPGRDPLAARAAADADQRRGRPGLAAAEPSLEAILALSYDALPSDARAPLRRLAVFGGQPLDYDAAAMAAVWQVDEEEALELRLALVEAGLVERTPRDGETLRAAPGDRPLCQRAGGRSRRRAGGRPGPRAITAMWWAATTTPSGRGG